MSVLDESRKVLKQELRRYVALLYTDANSVEVHRQRHHLRQLFTDVRCSALAMSSVAPPTASPSRDNARGAAKRNKAGAVAVTAATTQQQQQSSRTARPASSVSSARLSSVRSAPSFAPADMSAERPASGARRDRPTELDATAVFVEECLAAAQYMMGRDMYEDAMELCLDPLAKEMRVTFRDVVARVEAARHAACNGAGNGNDGDHKHEERRLQFDTDRRSQPDASSKTSACVKELLPTWRLTVQYDLLHRACQFYIAFRADSQMEERAEMFRFASNHIDAMTSRLLVVAAVDADDSYHLLFNGSIMVYEMCLHMMWKAGDFAGDALPHVIHHVALCLNMCESATLKLATVRYMPWRVRMYDYLAACYEKQGAYAEALVVAQRACRKVQELIELEMLDPVPPSPSNQDAMLRALDHVMLNVMRYTWYVNCATRANHTEGGGGATDGAMPSRQSQQGAASTGAGAQQELFLGDMPHSGFEMIDRAWQMLLKVELPKRPTEPQSLNAMPARGSTIKQQQQQQQRQDAKQKELTAERVQGALVRFLLSFATAPTPLPQQQQQQQRPSFLERHDRGTHGHPASDRDRSLSLLPSRESFQQWAIEALGFLACRAACTYAQTNPDVRQEGLPEGFAEALALPRPKQVTPPTKGNAKGGKKNAASRRSNRTQSSVSVNVAAVEDEVFLSKVTLETILYDLALPNVLMPVDAENNSGTKTSKPSLVSEESLLLALLLHRVLCDDMSAKPFDCLCTCSLACLQQHRMEEEDVKQNTMTKTINSNSNKKAGVFSKKTLHVRLLDAIFVSLRLFQGMRRADASDRAVRISDLRSIARDLERLVELYAGAKAAPAAGGKTQQVKKDGTMTTVLPPPLSTSKAISSGLGALYQRFMEECADFLQQRVSLFTPSLLKSPPFPNAAAMTLAKDATLSREEGVKEELEEDSTDMYHSIVWAYLWAKVKSGLTDAAKIGQLVLAYAREVETDLSTKNSGSDGNAADKCQNTRQDAGDCKSTTKKAADSKISDSSLNLIYALDDSMRALRQTCMRARLALDAIHMALECFERPQTRASLMKRNMNPGVAHVSIVPQTEWTHPLAGTTEEEEKKRKREREKELRRICCEQETRDVRTELTRWMVELRWHSAIHRQHYAVLEKYKSDIKLLTDRQANTKVYGATTLKETNVLEAFLKARPEAPRVSEEEKGRLLAWARDEGDELLHALVLMCLAPHQLHSKAQREMLEEAFHVLQRYENCRGGGGKGQTLLSSMKQQGESAYSAFMIWCYAVTICGKLGFTNMTENAKDVLLAAFASSGKGHQATEKKKKGDVAASPTSDAAAFESDSVQTSMLTVHPDEDMLAVSSALQIQTLALALLWMSTVEMRRIPYHNFDASGLMPFTGKSLLLEVPFEQRYGFSKTQLWYMRSAYRIRFAMQLADRVNDSGLMLQCAFELFNTLLPSLMDETYCPFLPPLLSMLCQALMRQPSYVWSDVYVQRLAVRTLDALLKTVRKMSAVGPDAELSGCDTAVTATTNETPNGDTGFTTAMPTSVQQWYELLLRVFAHVWGLVHDFPNPRQVRYRESVRQGAAAVQRVLGPHPDAATGVRSAVASATVTAARTPQSRANRATNAPPATAATTATAVEALTTGNGAAPAFPGAYYAVADTIVDDLVPIEFLELLGDILFTVPGAVSFFSQASTLSREVSVDETAPKGASDALVGIPVWLLGVARALASKSPYVALERLQQVENNPLYAKAAVYIVEHFMRQGDLTTARRVATDALRTIQNLHKSVREHQQSVFEDMVAWLEREGYTVAALTRLNKKTTPEEPPVKGKRRKSRSVTKETMHLQPQMENKFFESSNPEGEKWTLAEQQMLRQLTRGFAWVRRRRALRWLRGRILQFNAPYKAQLELYLSVCAQKSLERRQRELQEGDQVAAAAAAAAAAATKLRAGAKSKARGEEVAAAAAAARTEELRAEEKEEKERFVQHAARAAVLFNRCGFPCRAFMAISQAIDGLRVFVCGEPPDLTLSDEVLLPQDDTRRSCWGEGNLNLGQDGPGAAVDSFSAPCHENGTAQTVVDVGEMLREWGPRVRPLAHALCHMLALIWGGFFDHRRDVDVLQPAAVKVGRDVLPEEQLHFQGRVPSLHAHTSAAGQYEEARLAHIAAVNRKRLARSLRWRTREVEVLEFRDRVAVHRQWLRELEELLTAYVEDGLLSLESHVATVRWKLEMPIEEETPGGVMAQEPMSKKTTKRSPRKVKIQETAQESALSDGAITPAMLALRLGSALPAERIIDYFMFLMRCMQFSCQLASLNLSVEVHKLTKGFFASELLPFVLSLQRTIGASGNDDLFDEYANLRRNEPVHKVLVQNARRLWERYTTTEAYQRVTNRLSRTLLPSRRSTKNDCMNAAPAVDSDAASSKASDRTPSLVRPAVARGGAHRLTLRDVVARFEAATTFLQQRRLFGLLAEQLYELGRIHLLHRQRVDAERCWLEAVDAALEMPESLKQPTSAWANLSIKTIGLPRVLMAVISLSSLAMYVYREQQGRAVDAYLLAARILERFFQQGTTSNFPQQLRDFGGFLLEDLIALPHLGDSFLTLMPQLVHHLLFLAWELLKFKFFFYAAMVASLTEYFARVHTRHVASTIEARLVQAVAASYFGNHRASMKVLRNVCQGVRIPSGAIEATALRVRAAVECVETVKPAKGGGKRGDGGGGGAASSHRTADLQLDQQQMQQPQIQPYLLPEGLYDDSELPVTPGNVACVQTFVAQCFRESAAAAAAAGTNASVLHEAVVASYGPRLSQRVELAVAESLIALGSREAAYVWCASSGGQRAGTAEKRTTRSRGLPVVSLHSFNNSACVEALNAAENILQSLLARLQERCGANVDNIARGKSPAREKNVLSEQEDTQEKCGLDVEERYLRCTSELFLARIHTARGECAKAIAFLQNLITDFNESTGANTFKPRGFGAPSFLWTVETHTFWCDVYELMVLNHVRVQEYEVARQVIRDALALCEQCGDPYCGRVFSLYEAAITAREGDIAKATETLCVLQQVSQSLKIDNRSDMLHAWIVMASGSLGRGAPCTGQKETSRLSAERLEFSVQALREYCEMHGLVSGCAPMPETNRPSFSRENAEEGQQRSLVAWNVKVVFLHRAMNLLAEEYMRLGKLDLAEGVLERAISTLTSHYDVSAHPTPLIESRLILARLLCLLNPSLLTEQKKSEERADSKPVHELTEDEVLNALDLPRRRPVQLLMAVVDQVVTSGTHDYSILRLALLYLATLLSRAERSFRCLAANCVAIAKLVEDMQFHVFSGTSIFSLYGEETVQLGSDISFAENIVAVIQSTRRGLGHITEKEATTAADFAATPTSPRATPEARHIPARGRSEREDSCQKNLLTLPILISAFASLHREMSLQLVFPPLESLDLETALKHVRAYLQLKTAPLSGHYLWYDTATRDAHIKQQQQQQQQQQGRAGEGGRASRTSPLTTDTNTAAATLSFLPPIVINKLPSLLSFGTLAQLGISKVNAVICQSFMSDANNFSSFGVVTKPASCRGAEQKSSAKPVAFSSLLKSDRLTFLLFVSPVHDPSVTQPLPPNDKSYPTLSKKPARLSRKNSSNALDLKTPTDSAPTDSLWGGALCVVFELPVDGLQSLHAQALETLQLMQCSSSSLMTLTADDGEEEVPVETALSQQLNEAMAVLTAKATPPVVGRRGVRAAAPVEFVPVSATQTTTAAAAAKQAGVLGQAEGAATVAEMAPADGEGDVPAVDEAKSKLITGFIELFVRSVVPRAVTDDNLMERSVEALLPHCAVSLDMVQFLNSMTAGNGGGGGGAVFHPGIHEWFSRMANFVMEHT